MAAIQVRITPENDKHFRDKAEAVGGSLQKQINMALDKVRKADEAEASEA